MVEILKGLRRDAGMTQTELAKRLGKPQSYVSKVERRERLLDPVELRWWCRELGCDVGDLIREWDRLIG